MILRTKESVETNPPFPSVTLYSITSGILFSISGYIFFGGFVCLGKISKSSPLNRGISSDTNLDKFISLRERINNISSSDFISNLFVLPAVLKTERMFLRPKS